MKKIATLLSFSLIWQPIAIAAPASTGSERGMVEPLGADSQYQKLMQESTRNREMIEIWKEHVRTLTQERDEAFKRIEELQAGPARKYTRSDKDSGPDPRISALENEKEAAMNRIRELNADLQAAKNPAGQSLLQRELKELREDREVMIRDKNNVMARIEELEAQLKNAKTASVSVSPETPVSVSPDLEIRVKKLEIENNRLVSAAGTREKELKARIDELEAAAPAGSDEKTRAVALENDTLRARNQNLAFIEKEFNEARIYFTSQVEELEAKLQAAANQNNALKSQLVSASKSDGRVTKIESLLEAERAARQAAEAAAGESRDSLAKIQEALAAEQKNNLAQNNEIRNLRARTQDLTVASQTTKAIQGQFENTRAALNTAVQEKLAMEESVSVLSDRIAILSAENRKLNLAQAESVKQADRLTELESELTEAVKRAAAAEDAIQAADSDRENLSAEVQALKGRLVSIDGVTRKIGALEGEVISANEAATVAEKEKQDALRQLQSLKFQLEKTHTRNSQISKDIEKERAAFAAAQQQLVAATDALKEAQNENAELAGGRQETDLEIQGLRERVQKLQAEADSQRQLEKMRGIELLKAKQAVAEKEEELRSLRSLELDNQALQARAEKVELIEQEMNDARAYLSSVIEALEEKNAQLVEEKEELRLSAEASALKASDLNDRVNELAAEGARAEELDAEISISRKTIEKLRAENEGIEKVEANLIAANARILQLQTQLKANLADIKNLRENFATLVEPLTQSFEERVSR